MQKLGTLVGLSKVPKQDGMQLGRDAKLYVAWQSLGRLGDPKIASNCCIC